MPSIVGANNESDASPKDGGERDNGMPTNVVGAKDESDAPSSQDDNDDKREDGWRMSSSNGESCQQQPESVFWRRNGMTGAEMKILLKHVRAGERARATTHDEDPSINDRDDEDPSINDRKAPIDGDSAEEINVIVGKERADERATATTDEPSNRPKFGDNKKPLEGGDLSIEEEPPLAIDIMQMAMDPKEVNVVGMETIMPKNANKTKTLTHNVMNFSTNLFKANDHKDKAEVAVELQSATSVVAAADTAAAMVQKKKNAAKAKKESRENKHYKKIAEQLGQCNKQIKYWSGNKIGGGWQSATQVSEAGEVKPYGEKKKNTVKNASIVRYENYKFGYVEVNLVMRAQNVAVQCYQKTRGLNTKNDLAFVGQMMTGECFRDYCGGGGFVRVKWPNNEQEWKPLKNLEELKYVGRRQRNPSQLYSPGNNEKPEYREGLTRAQSLSKGGAQVLEKAWEQTGGSPTLNAIWTAKDTCLPSLNCLLSSKQRRSKLGLGEEELVHSLLAMSLTYEALKEKNNDVVVKLYEVLNEAEHKEKITHPKRGGRPLCKKMKCNTPARFGDIHCLKHSQKEPKLCNKCLERKQRRKGGLCERCFSKKPEINNHWCIICRVRESREVGGRCGQCILDKKEVKRLCSSCFKNQPHRKGGLCDTCFKNKETKQSCKKRKFVQMD